MRAIAKLARAAGAGAMSAFDGILTATGLAKVISGRKDIKVRINPMVTPHLDIDANTIVLPGSLRRGMREQEARNFRAFILHEAGSEAKRNRWARALLRKYGKTIAGGDLWNLCNGLGDAIMDRDTVVEWPGYGADLFAFVAEDAAKVLGRGGAASKMDVHNGAQRVHLFALLFKYAGYGIASREEMRQALPDAIPWLDNPIIAAALDAPARTQGAMIPQLEKVLPEIRRHPACEPQETEQGAGAGDGDAGDDGEESQAGDSGGGESGESGEQEPGEEQAGDSGGGGAGGDDHADADAASKSEAESAPGHESESAPESGESAGGEQEPGETESASESGGESGESGEEQGAADADGDSGEETGNGTESASDAAGGDADSSGEQGASASGEETAEERATRLGDPTGETAESAPGHEDAPVSTHDPLEQLAEEMRKLFSDAASALDGDAMSEAAQMSDVRPLAGNPRAMTAEERRLCESVKRNLRAVMRGDTIDRDPRQKRGRVDRRQLGRFAVGLDRRPFEKRREVPGEAAAMALLLDESSSMGASQTESVRVCARAWSEAAHDMDIPAAVIGFGGNGAIPRRFVAPGEPPGVWRRRLGRICARGSTPMAPAIIAAVDALLLMPQPMKMLFIATDGGPDNAIAVHGAIQMAKLYGIIVVTLGIHIPADPTLAYSGYGIDGGAFQGSWVHVPNVAHLTQIGMREVAGLIRKARGHTRRMGAGARLRAG